MFALKNIITAILLGTFAFIVVLGPRPQPEDPEGRVEILYWEKWTGREAEQMEQIVNWFNDTVGREKGIYVRYLSMSQIDRKTLVATAAGVPPDIAGLWDNQVAQFAALDALEPLCQLAAEHGITEGYYKPTYWQSCHYNGRLYALVSTPAAVALHWNRATFLEHADALRAAGLDPNRPPSTIDELDRYAMVLDNFTETRDGRRRLNRSGYLPMEPGWFLNYTGYWFGAQLYDPETDQILIDTPEMLAAMNWIQGYSRRLGTDTMTQFRGGFGQFDSPQNAFLSGAVVMVQQGPWMANFIENLRPDWNRWHMPREEADRLPLEQRRENIKWAAAPFPSAVEGLEYVTYAGFDTLVIPRGARHPREAFEFIAFVNRQDVMERLNSLHCKNSPLAEVSEDFILNHPNPYIDVFEQLAASPNARGIPPIPIWPEVGAELGAMIENVYLLRVEPAAALRASQARLERLYAQYKARQAARNANAEAEQ